MKGFELFLVLFLLVVLVALFVISYMRRKKYNTNLNQLREELKKGDKVMTDSGVVGEVVDMYTEEEYKYVVLKSGKGNNTGYFTVHANAIYYVYEKETNNNIETKATTNVDNTSATTQVEKTKTEGKAKKSNK